MEQRKVYLQSISVVCVEKYCDLEKWMMGGGLIESKELGT